MSIEYDNYLIEHRTNVTRGAEWIAHNLPDLLSNHEDLYYRIIVEHDRSKDGYEEYDAYDNYFYGGRRTKAVKEDFDRAWLHHIHHNPHHWQHWVLINDEAEEGIITLRMPCRYVLEMICDWWAFSWSKGNLYEIFDWYENHKEHMMLHEDTRELVEEILGEIKTKLDDAKRTGDEAMNGERN